MVNKNIVYFREYNYVNNEYSLDNQIFVFYDEESENFCYNGTRKHSMGKTNYQSYNGVFSSDRIDEMTHFLKIIFNNFSSSLTTEIHQIQLNHSEYKKVNFDYLSKKITRVNELVAYDMKQETYDSVLHYLMSLRTN